MRSTIRLGRIFGVNVALHWSVLVIAGLIGFTLTDGVADAELWAVVVPTVVVFLACLLAHELAHSVVAERNGLRVHGITLWLLGGVAQLAGPMPSAGSEFRIAVAGPAMSYALAGIFFAGAGVAHALGGSALLVSAFDWLAFVNVVLGTFNLVPAAPLDGGRILASAIWAVTKNRTRSDVFATRVGQGFGGALVVVGLVGPLVRVPYVSVWTALMGLFILRTATAELRYARTVGHVRLDLHQGDAVLDCSNVATGSIARIDEHLVDPRLAVPNLVVPDPVVQGSVDVQR